MRAVTLGLDRTVLELKMYSREKEAVFFSFLMPILLLALFSVIFRQLSSRGDSSGGMTAGGYFLPGMLSAGVLLNEVFQTMAMSVTSERDDGTLKRLRATPMPPVAYFLGKVGLVAVASTVQVALLLSEEAELLELPFDGSRGRLDPSPLYLVCSHGRHDPCCGERGRPVVASLAASRPERVWQASHLGGCRFAPTVLVLPLGIMYGRVPPSAAADVVAAAEAGEVLGGLFRGRIGIPPAAQAGIGFAHECLTMPRVKDVSLVSTNVIDGATVVVRIDTPKGPFDITVERTRIDATGLTCGAPGPSWFLAHRPLTIEPTSGP